MDLKISITRLLFLVLFTFIISCSRQGKQSVTILQTTDLHGVLLPYDFIEKEDLKVSLAAVSSYVKKVRGENGSVVLLDNGDNLQGQPPVYYYNFIDPPRVSRPWGLKEI